MTNNERFSKALSFNKEIDRTPVIEWASWWDQTLDIWYGQGLPRELDAEDGINAHFGQDKLHQFWLPVLDPGFPAAASHGAAIIQNEQDYRRLRHMMYSDWALEETDRRIRTFTEAHRDEDFVYWITLEGFFWFPRILFGIENHLYAFYDYPELMMEINSDLCEFHEKALKVVYSHIKPAFITFAEDMSYNLGPMLSREQYDMFLLPFYRKLTPIIEQNGTVPMIDTDGFVEPLIPWFLEGGLRGILPLERMAGVDVNRIRENHPGLIMIGGFDKVIMHKGEAAMRAEFERILPAIRSGGYIPSVDHQTPPDVSIENYKCYMKLLHEYSRMP